MAKEKKKLCRIVWYYEIYALFRFGWMLLSMIIGAWQSILTYVCMSPKLTLNGKRVNRRTGHRLVITSLTPDLCMYLRQSFVFRNIFARKSKACSCPNYGEPFKIRYVPVWRTHLWLLYEIYALPTHPHTHTFIYTYSYIESNTLSGAVRATIWHWQAKPFLSFSCYGFGRVTTSHRCMCYMSGKYIYIHVYRTQYAVKCPISFEAFN